jgi:hypothetical protein
MEAKDAIEKVRKALNDLEANGQKLVSTEGLRNFLDSVEKEAGASIELSKLRHESHLTQYKAERELAIELFRSVISSGQHALKTSILVNGGAAVALLAFVSNVWTKTQAPQVARALTLSIVYFGIAVLVGAVSTGTTYVTQYFYERSHDKTGLVFHVFTVLLVISSYVLFGLGVFSVYEALTKHLAP